jgi:DNA-binding LacI/PurR family transcriptional regulator
VKRWREGATLVRAGKGKKAGCISGGDIYRKRLKSNCYEIPKRRIEGYLEVLDRNGSGYPVMLWECSGSNEESGRTAAAGILSRESRPTAILATSDRLAIGFMDAARSRQLRVPQDIAVMGFDDIPAAKWSPRG